jgi:energy-coupling factor transport system permease protein
MADSTGIKPADIMDLYKAAGIGADLKLVLLLCLSIIVLMVDNLVTLTVISLLIFAVFAAAGVGRRRFAIWLLLSLAVVWGFVLTQSIFYPYRPRTLVFVIITPETPVLGALTGGIALYWEGAVHGLTQSLRMLALLTAGLTVVWTTPAHEILLGLRRLRLPYRAAFMLTTALRFIPTIGSEARSVLIAMRARGYQMRPAKPWRYLRALAVGLTPILHRNMRRAAMLADSVESKGFLLADPYGADASSRSFATGHLVTASNAHSAKTLVKLLRITALAAAPAFTILLAGAKLLTFAAQTGLFYLSSCEWIYELVETHL